MACILDRRAETTLLQRRNAGDPTREDLALIVREPTQELRIEIVDHARLLQRIRALLRLIPLLAERRIDRVRIWCCWHCHDDIS